MSNVSPVLESLIAILHYEKLTEYEKVETMQAKYLADLTVQTKQLEANREVMNQYYAQHFEEQQLMYEKANEILDVAIKNGNAELAQVAMRVIQIVHSNKVKF